MEMHLDTQAVLMVCPLRGGIGIGMRCNTYIVLRVYGLQLRRVAGAAFAAAADAPVLRFSSGGFGTLPLTGGMMSNAAV